MHRVFLDPCSLPKTEGEALEGQGAQTEIFRVLIALGFEYVQSVSRVSVCVSVTNTPFSLPRGLFLSPSPSLLQSSCVTTHTLDTPTHHPIHIPARTRTPNDPSSHARNSPTHPATPPSPMHTQINYAAGCRDGDERSGEGCNISDPIVHIAVEAW